MLKLVAVVAIMLTTLNLTQQLVFGVSGAELLTEPDNPIFLHNQAGAIILYNEAFNHYNKLEYKPALNKWNEFKQIYQNDPLIIKTFYHTAKIFIEINQPAEALKQLKHLFTNYSHKTVYFQTQSSALLELLGKAYEDLPDIELSRYYYGKIIELHPHSAQANTAKIKLGLTDYE